MKTKKSFLSYCVITVLAFYVITLSGCNGKDGDPGPAGANGQNGLDGNAVTAADQASYDAADGIKGARYYNHFISELALTDTALTNHTDFYRCKQCHGWDLIGSNGAYINRAPNANRPAVAANDLRVFAATHNVREVFDAVKHSGGRTKSTSSLNGSMPDYGVILTDAQIWDIAKFLKKEAFNTFNLYDINTTGVYPTGTVSYKNIGKGGNATSGKAVYDSKCQGCHGADGTTYDFGNAYIGDFMRSKPYELQHKGAFGDPAAPMSSFNITETQMMDLLKAGQDTVLFPGF